MGMVLLKAFCVDRFAGDAGDADVPHGPQDAGW